MSIEIVEPVRFTVEKNHYLIDDKKYWRATRVKSIIKNPGLINWQVAKGKQEYTRIMNERADFGTNVHRLIKLTLENKYIDFEHCDKETSEDLVLFSKFLKEHKVEPELLEQHLWSERYGYAGTADFIGYVDNKLMILDWKTSKKIYDDMWLQLAAYAYALQELMSIPVNSVGILQLRDNKSKFETKKHNDVMKDFDIFKACLKIHNWQKK